MLSLVPRGELHNIRFLRCYAVSNCPRYYWTMKMIHCDKLFIISAPFYLLHLKGILESSRVDNAEPDAVCGTRLFYSEHQR